MALIPLFAFDIGDIFKMVGVWMLGGTTWTEGMIGGFMDWVCNLNESKGGLRNSGWGITGSDAAESGFNIFWWKEGDLWFKLSWSKDISIVQWKQWEG
jgi:hypothetical protein